MTSTAINLLTKSDPRLTKECMICREDVSENNILTFCNDKHSFCKSCLNDYEKSFKNEKPIICPYCRSIIHGKEEVTIINNKKEGLYRSFDFNNNIKIECNYVNDIKEGLYKEYYKSGDIKIECTYMNDKKEGLCKKWYDNKEKFYECNYVNDKKEGLYQQYYRNGKKYMECNYVNDKEEGLYQEWYENGEKILNIIM